MLVLVPLSLLAGLVLSLGSSVICAALSTMSADLEWQMTHIEHRTFPAPEPHWLEAVGWSDPERWSFGASRDAGIGIERIRFTGHLRALEEGTMGCVLAGPFAIQLRAGWPVACLEGELLDTTLVTGEWSTRHAVRLGRPLEPRVGPTVERSQLLPLRPRWPGLLADTALYAGVIGAIIGLPPGLRRAARRNRGRCVACGYPRGDSVICSECGSAASGPA